MQIDWDEPDNLKNVPRVSPWEVEHVLPTSARSASSRTKKKRVSPEFSSSGGGDLFQPVMGLSNSKRGCLDRCDGIYTSSASMQGARQDQFYLSKFISENINPIFSGGCVNHGMKLKFNCISPKMNIGSSQNENLSSNNPSSVHNSGSEVARKVGMDMPTKGVAHSFQLFGKIIHVEEPAAVSSDYTGCMEGESKEVLEDDEGANMPAKVPQPLKLVL